MLGNQPIQKLLHLRSFVQEARWHFFEPDKNSADPQTAQPPGWRNVHKAYTSIAAHRWKPGSITWRPQHVRRYGEEATLLARLPPRWRQHNRGSIACRRCKKGDQRLVRCTSSAPLR